MPAQAASIVVETLLTHCKSAARRILIHAGHMTDTTARRLHNPQNTEISKMQQRARTNLIQDKVINPSGSLGQQPGDGLGDGVATHRVAEHPAVVLIQGSNVEPYSAGLALVHIRRDIPEIHKSPSACTFDK